MLFNFGSPNKRWGYQKTRLAISLAISILGHVWVLNSGFHPTIISTHSLHDDSRLALQIQLNTSVQPEQPAVFAGERREPLHDTNFPPNPEQNILFKSHKPASSDNQEKNTSSQPASLEAPNLPLVASDAKRLSEYRLVGLDPPPRPLHDIDPTYPLEAGSREGTVAMRLLIDEKGAVDNVFVISSFPQGMFDDSAIQAFKSARFSPGLFLGMPVKSQLIVEVEFMPINRGGNISGRSY